MSCRTKNKEIKKVEAEATICYYCGRRFEDTYHKAKVVEHFVPLSREGSNSNSNKEIACKDCDTMKGKKHPHRFMIKCHFYAKNYDPRTPKQYNKFGYTQAQLYRIAYAVEVFEVLH